MSVTKLKLGLAVLILGGVSARAGGLKVEPPTAPSAWQLSSQPRFNHQLFDEGFVFLLSEVLHEAIQRS